MASHEPVYLYLSPEFPQAIIHLVFRHNTKMVYWDLGGTMVDLSQAIKERAVKKINMTYRRDIDIEMFNNAVRTEWQRRETPEAQKEIKAVNDEKKERQYWIEFYTCVLKHLAIRVRNQQIVRWLATMQQNPESFEVLPHVLETIKRLREIGISVGVISNAFPSARKILEKSGMIREFHEQHVILSCEYNSIKPEGSIYREAINRANVKPDEILFIDDRKSFVDGATKNGMKAVVINAMQGKAPNDSGRPKSGIEQFIENLLLHVWLVGHRFKHTIIRLARSTIGFLWHQSIRSLIESSLPRPGM